jgi:hypothetical protein
MQNALSSPQESFGHFFLEQYRGMRESRLQDSASRCAVPLEGLCGYAPGHASGTGPLLGQAHSWDRPPLAQAHSWDRSTLGTGPLSGQTLQDSWDNPALIYSTNFATQAGFGSHSLLVLSRQQASICNQRRKRD